MYKYTNRVAQFFSMVLAHMELTSEKPIDENSVLIPFMGSGASDNLTYKNVKDFLKEVNDNQKREKCS